VGDDVSAADILFDRQGAAGIVTLNRPKALNAVTHDMVLALHAHLDEWASDPAVTRVVITAAGEKAFSAGGDVRALYDLGKAGKHDEALRFWADEYPLNAAIKNFRKPYVALIDGIVMGGGVGISVHGSHRIVSEHVAFAMPETAIGLVPDVGASYLLSRMPGGVGLYLGLTGTRLGAADAMAVGVGTHHLLRADLDPLEEALAAGPEPVDRIIDRHRREAGAAPILAQREEIDRHFGHPTLSQLRESLAAGNTGFAKATLATLSVRSPTALALAFRALRDGRQKSFEDCLRMEWGIVSRMDERSDFAEGIRALITDKDNRPRWNPSRLDQVRDADIARYFEPADGPPLDLGERFNQGAIS
jgi:enoyl-CoA hydratase